MASSRQFERVNKSFHAHITKADEGIVEAIVNVFGIVDYMNDIVKKGAFAKTISERWSKIRILDQHNTDSVINAIAKVLAIRELEASELPMEIVSEYPEATGGLWIRMQYMMDDEHSRAVFNRIKNGLIDEYSIGFDIILKHYEAVEWRGKKVNARVIDEIRLFEASSVLWGANQATATVSAKEYLAACLYKAGNYTNDEFLSSGLTNADEHASIGEAIKAGVNTALNSIPEDLAIRPMDMGWGVMWWARALTEDVKQQTLQTIKEGRTISAANAERLRVAYAALTEILQAAGLIDTEVESDGLNNTLNEGKSSEQPEGDGSLLDNEPEAPALVEPPKQALTTLERERLLAQINLEIHSLGG
jgi:HK97 family phage prohead protease